MGVLGKIARSFAAKLAVLLVIFVALSVIVYDALQAAYAERNALLLRTIQEQGQLVTRSLHPLLESFQGKSAQALVDTLARLGTGKTRIKLLFRPRVATSPESFFYVASAPTVGADYLAREKEELIERGILGRLPQSCEGGVQSAQRYVNPQGLEEIVTSITPVRIPAGCWVVITSRDLAGDLTSAFGRPYWQTPEMRIAGGMYVAMVLIVLSVFLVVWRSIRRFATHARDLRTGKANGRSFASLNRIPELSGAADEFDDLVAALRRSAERIRQAAEENAHALKAPLAVISQSVEPLRSGIDPADTRRRRSLELIERSVTKLDALISAARRVEEVAADGMDPAREPVRLSNMIDSMVRGYAAPDAEDVPRVVGSVAPGIVVEGDEEMLETAIENLIENALSFSPSDGTVRVALVRDSGTAILTVEDDGPGVPTDRLERIFQRYYSSRPEESPESSAGGSHFGIGLWVARRNVEALGGGIDAENIDPHGLRVTLRLPLSE